MLPDKHVKVSQSSCGSPRATGAWQWCHLVLCFSATDAQNYPECDHTLPREAEREKVSTSC